jgi:hypothetical protein
LAPLAALRGHAKAARDAAYLLKSALERQTGESA